jgi:hypothetical protein
MKYKYDIGQEVYFIDHHYLKGYMVSKGQIDSIEYNKYFIMGHGSVIEENVFNNKNDAIKRMRFLTESKDIEGALSNNEN